MSEDLRTLYDTCPDFGVFDRRLEMLRRTVADLDADYHFNASENDDCYWVCHEQWPFDPVNDWLRVTPATAIMHREHSLFMDSRCPKFVFLGKECELPAVPKVSIKTLQTYVLERICCIKRLCDKNADEDSIA